MLIQGLTWQPDNKCPEFLVHPIPNIGFLHFVYKDDPFQALQPLLYDQFKRWSFNPIPILGDESVVDPGCSWINHIAILRHPWHPLFSDKPWFLLVSQT
jgi:hypothetical protein